KDLNRLRPLSLLLFVSFFFPLGMMSCPWIGVCVCVWACVTTSVSHCVLLCVCVWLCVCVCVCVLVRDETHPRQACCCERSSSQCSWPASGYGMTGSSSSRSPAGRETPRGAPHNRTPVR